MHHQWANVTQSYLNANRALSPLKLWREGPKRELLPLAAIFVLMICVAGSLYRVEIPVWPIVCLWAVAMLMLLCFKSMDRIAARRYADEYAQYAIDRQPFTKRIDFLAYALFKQRITQIGYSCEQLQAIADYSETLAPPSKPFLISQHVVTVSLLTVLGGMFINYLQVMPHWANQGLWYIWVVACLTVLVSVVLDGIQTAQSRDIRIRRYLKRVQIEMAFERLAKGMGQAPAGECADEGTSEPSALQCHR